MRGADLPYFVLGPTPSGRPSSRELPRSNVQEYRAHTSFRDDEETTLDLLTNTTGEHAAGTHFKKIAR
ncbi:MAG TPA: hypothetical protein VGJ20_08270 [Xanthobacteraceae bacterium]